MAQRLDRWTARSQRAARGAACLFLICLPAGCAPQWFLEYQTAENQARAKEQPLVIFYKDPFDLQSSAMEDLLESPAARPPLNGKVRCLLTTEFAPHRRYVAQYGILQPPALAIVHPDGTYHSTSGPITTIDQLRQFFAQARPPGLVPVANPQIPRNIDIRFYRWEGDFEAALSKARRQGRELCIVYKWWLSPESNDLLAVLHSRPEVARHFADTINCLLDLDYAPNRAFVRRFGVTTVPAIILVHRDGTYHSHTGAMSADQIIRFVTASQGPGAVPGDDAAERMSTRASYRWYSDFPRAQAHARQRGVKLFVFFSSLYSDASNRMARVLGREDVAALFTETINCRLDFSLAVNRQIMARYRVRQTPAFLVIRPDGTYHARTGVLSPEELADLLRAARESGLLPHEGEIGP